MEIAIRQNLVSVGGENVDTLQQNKPRRPKRKRSGLDEGAREVQLEKIRMQATRAVVKKVKTAAEKAQSTCNGVTRDRLAEPQSSRLDTE